MAGFGQQNQPGGILPLIIGITVFIVVLVGALGIIGDFRFGFIVPIVLITVLFNVFRRIARAAQDSAKSQSADSRPRVVQGSSPASAQQHSAPRQPVGRRRPAPASAPTVAFERAEPDGRAVHEDSTLSDAELEQRRRQRRDDYNRRLSDIRRRERSGGSAGDTPPGHVICFNCGNTVRLRGKRGRCSSCGTEIFEE